ncbi:MAG: hypothetical protein R3B84_19140 [Zavarzinella sp.]
MEASKRKNFQKLIEFFDKHRGMVVFHLFLITIVLLTSVFKLHFPGETPFVSAATVLIAFGLILIFFNYLNQQDELEHARKSCLLISESQRTIMEFAAITAQLEAIAILHHQTENLIRSYPEYRNAVLDELFVQAELDVLSAEINGFVEDLSIKVHSEPYRENIRHQMAKRARQKACFQSFQDELHQLCTLKDQIYRSFSFPQSHPGPTEEYLNRI